MLELLSDKNTFKEKVTYLRNNTKYILLNARRIIVKILKIKVDGFKNLANIEIEFSSITSLVGLNNFGKSNVIESIDFGFDFIRFKPKIKDEMMSYSKAIPINTKLDRKNFDFSIECNISHLSRIKFQITAGLILVESEILYTI
jgi:recombinational DNA repair ATPase RecF